MCASFMRRCNLFRDETPTGSRYKHVMVMGDQEKTNASKITAFVCSNFLFLLNGINFIFNLIIEFLLWISLDFITWNEINFFVRSYRDSCKTV
jgi:hypothetical protein